MSEVHGAGDGGRRLMCTNGEEATGEESRTEMADGAQGRVKRC